MKHTDEIASYEKKFADLDERKLTEEDRKANKDYFLLMYENLELLKKQLYN